MIESRSIRWSSQMLLKTTMPVSNAAMKQMQMRLGKHIESWVSLHVASAAMIAGLFLFRSTKMAS